MTQSLAEFLPDVYRKFLSGELAMDVPLEPRSTCDNCAMNSRNLKTAFVPRPFNQQTKCCTYFPKLPNYLVGGVLRDKTHQQGQMRLRGLIKARTGVQPWGILPGPTYELLANHGDNAFGRAEALICPYYEKQTGHCGIWQYRDAVCSTYFCKHESGKVGREFWMALKTYMVAVEQALALFAVYSLFPAAANPGVGKTPRQEEVKLTADELDGHPASDQAWDKVWGEWVGREEEFYRQCHDVVSRLSPDEFQKVVGIEGVIRLRTLLRKHGRLQQKDLPRRLMFNQSAKVRRTGDKEVQLATYSSLNPFITTPGILAVLREFSGNDDATVELKLANERLGQAVTAGILHKAWQYNVLLPND